ncbi:MAG: acyltransferase family protein [Deltaproteobacteria bacterium]|nr:acyltransferase family protein [Deltaproteobacteria bacterium]
MAGTSPGTRRHELDGLRVLAFALLMLYHVARLFDPTDWHVKNDHLLPWLEPPMDFLHQWRMPLLFFISGAATWFMAAKHSVGRFVIERHRRLLIPLVFGMLVVVPPQVYVERIAHGATFGYAEFYRSIFAFEPYPRGNFSWHHLWYLPYILVYSMVLLPIIHILKRPEARARLAALNARLARGHTLYLLFAPIALSEVVLRPHWPENANNLLGDWSQFTSMLLVFGFGYALAGSDHVWATLEHLRRRSLLLGVLTFAALFATWQLDLAHASAPAIAAYRVLRSLNMWLWVLAVLGFGRHHLRRPWRGLQYANNAVYPFYVLHQTIIVVVGYFLARWSGPVALEFAIELVATFGGCWLLYEGLIKRWGPLRAVFGLTWAPKRVPSP